MNREINTCLKKEWNDIKILIRSVRIDLNEPDYMSKIKRRVLCEEKLFLVEIYKNNIDYLKNNHKKIWEIEWMIFLTFVIATAHSNDIELLKLVIDAFKININEKDKDKESVWVKLLEIAFAHNTNLQVIKYIFNQLNMIDNGSYCFIQACKQNPNVEIVKYLYENLNGSRQKLYDKNNIHVLVLAINYNKNSEIIKYLIEYGHIKILHNMENKFIQKLIHTLKFEDIMEYVQIIKCHYFIKRFLDNFKRLKTKKEYFIIVKIIYDNNPLILSNEIYNELGMKILMKKNLILLLNMLTN